LPFGSRQGVRTGGCRPFGPHDPQPQSVEANINDERSVADALSLWCCKCGQPLPRARTGDLWRDNLGERRILVLFVAWQDLSFRSRRVGPTGGSASARAGVERLVHISGIGADVVPRCNLHTIGSDVRPG
jgi:hypothetical protein